LSRTVTFSIYKHSVPHPSVGIIQGDEVAGWLVAWEHEGLHDQEAPILIIGVADRGDNGACNFTQDHLTVFGIALLKRKVELAVGANVQLVDETDER
jgi:hypothetical protein